jgi:hypothetical protein
MKVRRVLDGFQAVVEYLLSFAFIISAIGLIGAPPLANHGVLSLIFGGHVALYVYMVWFFFIGFGLIYAKLARKKKLHKYMLMVIYLTTIYTSILSLTVLGFAWTEIIDDVIIGVLAAWFWLRWKFKTEYIDPKDFSSAKRHLQGPPPLP